MSGFVGFSLMIVQGLTSAFLHCYLFERNSYVIKLSRICAVIDCLLLGNLRKRRAVRQNVPKKLIWNFLMEGLGSSEFINTTPCMADV